MKTVLRLTLLLASTTALVACGGPKQSSPPPPPPISAAARAEGEQLFSTRCGACHGLEGKGNGPAAIGFNPKPRNFTDAVWQASVTDEHIEKIIVYGGAAVGKNPAMPPNPDLIAKPEVVKALRMHVRLLGSH